MAVKICPYCHSRDTKRDGISDGIQRYKCNNCKIRFRSKRRPKKLQKVIFNEYIYKRQTLSDLAYGYKNKYTSMNQYIKYITQEQ